MTNPHDENQSAILLRINDWLAEPTLKCVSFAAKGLWIDLLCLMHRSPVRGFLLTPQKKVADDNWIAKQTGGTSEQIAELLDELDREHVFSRLDDPALSNDRYLFSEIPDECIVCRKMFRETALKRKRSAAGRIGAQHKLLAVEPISSKELEKTVAIAVGKKAVELYGHCVKPPSLDTSRPQAKKNAAKLYEEGVPAEDLIAAVLNYAEHCALLRKDVEYRKNAGNFFGKEEVYKQFLPKAYKPPISSGKRKRSGRYER